MSVKSKGTSVMTGAGREANSKSRSSSKREFSGRFFAVASPIAERMKEEREEEEKDEEQDMRRKRNEEEKSPRRKGGGGGGEEENRWKGVREYRASAKTCRPWPPSLA